MSTLSADTHLSDLLAFFWTVCNVKQSEFLPVNVYHR